MTVPDPLAAPPLRRRMAAWLYEGLLLFAVALIAALIFSVAVQMRSGIDERRPLLMAFLAVVFAVYFSFFWSKGQTLAMKTWRITVVDRGGRRISQGHALLRYLCCWVWVLPPIAMVAPHHLPLVQQAVIFFAWVAFWALLSLFHPQRQFWHDHFAGTRLVEAAADAPRP